MTTAANAASCPPRAVAGAGCGFDFGCGAGGVGARSTSARVAAGGVEGRVWARPAASTNARNAASASVPLRPDTFDGEGEGSTEVGWTGFGAGTPIPWTVSLWEETWGRGGGRSESGTRCAADSRREVGSRPPSRPGRRGSPHPRYRAVSRTRGPASCRARGRRPRARPWSRRWRRRRSGAAPPSSAA